MLYEQFPPYAEAIFQERSTLENIKDKHILIDEKYSRAQKSKPSFFAVEETIKEIYLQGRLSFYYVRNGSYNF